VIHNRKFQIPEDFFRNLHQYGTTLIDFKENKVPCIYVDSRRYDQIIRTVYGKKLAVDTVLNIYHDGRYVFVDIQMKFLNTGIVENFLLYANKMLSFFEALSKTGLIALAPNRSYSGNDLNIFMIQLPRREAAVNAFKLIKSNVKQSDGKDGLTH
jgi:hypothetical protein